MKLLRVLAGVAAGCGLAVLQPGDRGELETVAWVALAAVLAAASAWLARPALRGAEVAVAVLGLVGFGSAGDFAPALLLVVLFAAPLAFALHGWHGVALLPLILGLWFVISGLGHKPHGTLTAIAVAAAAGWLMSNARPGFATPRRR